MSEPRKPGFTACDYKEITVGSDKASLYLDCYACFGWQQDENFPPRESGGKVALRLRRDRRLVNKIELTRLQRHFEANLQEIAALERTKTSTASIWAISIAILGTAFMTGSVFAVVADPPQIVLSILLAIPAFAGWIAPYFVYRQIKENKTRQITPFIEEKIKEIYEICEKGQSLL